MEVDTPMQPPRLADIKKDHAHHASKYDVPITFSKEQVNPIKDYNNVNLYNDIVTKELVDNSDKTSSGANSKMPMKGVRQRKNS